MSTWAQHPNMPSEQSPMPQRTPEEEAMKQTEMLVRELGLTDEVQRDTLYRMHLKFARLRRQHNTRMDLLNQMTQSTEELKGILTSEQFDRFMNRQMSPEPRRPQHQMGTMPPPPMHEGGQRPPMPPNYP